MKLAFGGGADFFNISSNPPGLYIDQVYHRSIMEMNEDGTKAAAATAAVIRKKNGAPREIPHKVVKADHPFVFAIQHVPSGACLFLGRVTNPPGGTPVSKTSVPKK
jgi:serpin B